MKRLYEKKDHLINRNRSLTSEQKVEIIEILGRHPSYENKIDWNRSNSLTYEDFLEVLRPLYINELDPRGLVEGEDYDLPINNKDEQLYIIYTYEASKILASNNAGPELWTRIPSWCGREEFTDEAHAFGYFDPEHGKMKPGAKWCISMQTSDRYWKQYSTDFLFFFWFRNKSSLRNNRKIAIAIRKTTWEIAFLYNGADNLIQSTLPSYITEAINEEKDNYKEKELNKIKSMFILNPHTNRYDYEWSLDYSLLGKLVSEDRNGFIIDFGEVAGSFRCSDLGLKSLKGSPQKVGKHFNCSGNQLPSLEGAPKEVGGDCYCHNNQLTSLEGAPQTVIGDFYCHNNHLTSLKGAPQEVDGSFYCTDNQLASLEGAPKEVGESFNCSKNSLTSLIGAPQKVGRSFYCFDNQLTSLEGAPKEVGWSFDCSWNALISLKGAPQKVGRDFDCSYNPNLHSLEGIGEVKGEIYKNYF